MILQDNLIPFFSGGLVLILILYTALGVKKGFVKQFLDLLSFIVSLVIAWLYSPVLARFFPLYAIKDSTITNIEILKIVNLRLNTIIWFVLIFLVMFVVLFVVKVLINTLGKLPIINLLNGFLGAVFGLIKGLLVLGIISVFLSNAFFLNGTDFKEKTLFKQFDEVASRTFSFLAKTLDESIIIQRFVNNPSNITQEQRQIVEKWLIRNGYKQDQVEEVFNSVNR